MERRSINSNSAAYEFLVWAGFIISFGATTVGLIAAPLLIWVKAFLGMGFLFMTVSAFSLAKSLRDKHEQSLLHNRISEARTEKLLAEVREN